MKSAVNVPFRVGPSRLRRDLDLTLVSSHFQRIGERLKAEGEAASSFHHSMNRGLIREAFVREFLIHNTSDLWGIGTGEIIHPETQSGGKRTQIDVVIHNRMYPKVSLATGIDLFFAETVSSFIEIKSTLRKADLVKTASVTKEIKKNTKLEPQRFNPTGTVKKPRPYSFVFAYDGPKYISTVLGWMKEASESDDYNLTQLKKEHPDQREFFDHTFIDGVFILQRGFVVVDALPFQSLIAGRHDVGDCLEHIWISSPEQELTVLWALINTLNRSMLWNTSDVTPYLGTVRFRSDP